MRSRASADSRSSSTALPVKKEEGQSFILVKCSPQGLSVGSKKPSVSAFLRKHLMNCGHSLVASTGFNLSHCALVIRIGLACSWLERTLKGVPCGTAPKAPLREFNTA